MKIQTINTIDKELIKKLLNTHAECKDAMKHLKKISNRIHYAIYEIEDILAKLTGLDMPEVEEYLENNDD